MPLHFHTYDGLAEYVAELEQTEELLSVQDVANGLWLVTRPKPRLGRPPKGVERR